MKKLSFSYRLSHSLTTSLEQITKLRQEILLTPLSPKLELKYRWEALIEKIYWSLQLDGEHLSKTEIVAVLTNQKKRKMSPLEVDIHRYRYAFEYIRRDWLGSQKPITSKTVLRLYELIGRGKKQDEEAITTLLNYMQSSTEHPVLQAAIALIEIIYAQPFTRDNERIARLTAYLFLYKYGYDVDSLVVLEEHFKQNTSAIEEIIKKLSKDGNITPWLEYIASGLATQLLSLNNKILEQRKETSTAVKLFDLTERQQAILTFLDKPGSRITNRRCTSLFGISQITASRELSKLASMGLLFAHGKGRSVYYTKV